MQQHEPGHEVSETARAGVQTAVADLAAANPDVAARISAATVQDTSDADVPSLSPTS
jgi:hypothetical protein